MLHKYYAKIIKKAEASSKVKKRAASPRKIEEPYSPLLRIPDFKKNELQIKLKKNSEFSYSPINFTSFLKKTSLVGKSPLTPEQRLSEIAVSLVSIYESLYNALRTDEVFFFS